jgi:hypothetical protein
MKDSQINICKHCGGDIRIRNPKGYCDHLYYPENCEVCKKANPSEIDKLKAEIARLNMLLVNPCNTKPARSKGGKT